MKTRSLLTAAFLTLTLAPGARAFQWNGVNQPNASTLALFHFDEGKGDRAANAAPDGSPLAFTSQKGGAADTSPTWAPQPPCLDGGKGKGILTVGGNPFTGPGASFEMDELLIQGGVLTDFTNPHGR